MTTHTFTLAEQDGYRRGAFPTSIPFSFARGDLLTTRNARLLNAEGKEIAAQIDVTVTWEDDSVKTADLVFGARVPIHDSADFTLECGPEISSSVDPPNALSVEETDRSVIVRQGPVTYTVNRDGYNLVDKATFDRDRWGGKHPLGAIPPGEKSFLTPGSSPPLLVLSDGQILKPTDVSVTPETCGPCAGRIRAEGSYGSTITFTHRITFYARVSWFKVDIELHGNVADAELVLESTLNLKAGPVTCASGARQRSDGRATSWTVVTDGESTVDIASIDSWMGANSVRFEVDTEARARAILPVVNPIPSVWYHFLVTPPADHFHTPAAAMPTDLEVQCG